MKLLTIALTLAVAASSTGVALAASPAVGVTDTEGQLITLEAGHASLQKWRLPATPPHPADNEPTAEEVGNCPVDGHHDAHHRAA